MGMPSQAAAAASSLPPLPPPDRINLAPCSQERVGQATVYPNARGTRFVVVSYLPAPDERDNDDLVLHVVKPGKIPMTRTAVKLQGQAHRVIDAEPGDHVILYSRREGNIDYHKLPLEETPLGPISFPDFVQTSPTVVFSQGRPPVRFPVGSEKTRFDLGDGLHLSTHTETNYEELLKHTAVAEKLEGFGYEKVEGDAYRLSAANIKYTDNSQSFPS